MGYLIKQPGKFEGEPYWVPELWDWALDSNEDVLVEDCGTLVSVFIVDDEMIRSYPELLSPYYAVGLWETDLGFVCHYLFERAEDLKQYISDCERGDDE
jgi:hypothetical protein